jgi:ABC-type branched-subunit amino acid transport system substrate-binding protein
VTYVDDVYGRAVAGGAMAEIERRGLNLVAEIPYRLTGVSVDDIDFDAIAEQVAASDADVLMVVAYLTDGVEIRRAVLRNGVQLDAMIGTSSSYCMPEFGRILGNEAVGVFASDKPSGDVLDPSSLRPEAAAALRWARDEYLDRFGEPMSAPALTGFAGGLALFGYVLPEADSLSPSDVAAAAVATRLPLGALPNGSGLELAGAGQPGAGSNLLATSVIWEWVAPGQREVVWPPQYATGLTVVDPA